MKLVMESGKNMAKEPKHGQTAPNMKATGTKVTCRAMAELSLPIRMNTVVNL